MHLRGQCSRTKANAIRCTATATKQRFPIGNRMVMTTIWVSFSPVFFTFEKNPKNYALTCKRKLKFRVSLNKSVAPL